MELALQIAPGVITQCLGSQEAQNYLLFLNRWNASLVSDPIQDLLLELQTRNFFLIQFQAGNISEEWRQNQKPREALSDAFPVDILDQVDALKSWLNNLKDKTVSVVAQSRGGIVAALIDDCACINKSLCFGYPFTDGVLEPYRIEALRRSTKPYYIFQGARDEYGGADVIDKHILPKNIAFTLFETDHGFMDISRSEATRMKDKALTLLTNF